MPLNSTDFKVWKTTTGGRGLLNRKNAKALRAADSAFERAVAAATNVAYLAALRELITELRALKADPRWTDKRDYMKSLRKRVKSEEVLMADIVSDDERKNTKVVIDDWLDEFLPIEPGIGSKYDIVDEDAFTRKVRRTCVKAILTKEEHISGPECGLMLIQQVANRYRSSEGYWSPGKSCQFITQWGGLPGVSTVRQVLSVSNQATQLEKYCEAVFRRQAGAGDLSVKHDLKQDGDRIVDASWSQFFPQLKVQGRFRPIFMGNEDDFRAMFR